MGVNTSALSKLFIGDVADDTVDTEGEFEALNLLAVGEIEDMGDFGDVANGITFTSLDDRRVRKFKGSFDAGNIGLTLGRDASDVGQASIRAAQATDFDHAFKITLNDGSSGSPSSPTTFYFRGKVMSYTTNIGNTDSIVRSTVDIAINSAILEIDAV